MKRNIVQIIALLLLLVVLPGLSWLYLSRGLDYRKATIEELKEYGKIPPFPYLLMQGDSLDARFLGGKLLVAYAYPPDAEAASGRVLEELQKIHHQFNERQDVLFLMLGAREDSARLLSAMERYKLQDPGQVFPVIATQDAGGDFGIGAQDNRATLVAIADSSGTIRQYYDFEDGNRVRRLVEHIALLMPVREREQAVLKREKEK